VNGGPRYRRGASHMAVEDTVSAPVRRRHSCVREANAGQIRAELLAVIDRGAAELIVDMTPTIFCDHVGADVTYSSLAAPLWPWLMMLRA
jgi:hypothetical protein